MQRAIEIKAARIVAVAHAERNDLDPLHEAFLESKRIAPRRRVQILVNRQRRFPDERETAGAGEPLGGIFIRALAKGIDGNHDEDAAREHGSRRDAAATAPGGVSPAKLRE